MNDFLIILYATTLSGSFLFLIVILFDRIFLNRIHLKQLYLFMKVSLLYFFLPGILIISTLFKFYSYRMNTMNTSEVSDLSVYNSLNNMISEKIPPDKLLIINSIFIIWLIGTITVIFIKNLYKGYNLHKLLKNCTLVKDNTFLEIIKEIATRYKINKKFTLYKCSYISSPFLIGIIKPRIVIPNIELSNEELEIIFRHELTHYKSNDILFRILVEIIQGMNWFNPMIVFFSHMFYDYGELTCDEKVSHQLTPSQKSTYAHLLVRLSECPPNVFHIVTFSNNSEHFLKRRIFIIMKGTKIKKTVTSSILAFSVALLSCPLVSAASSWSASQVHNEIIAATIAENSVGELYMPHKYIEYDDNAKLAENINIVLNSSTRGANVIDVAIPVNGGAITNKFTATAGKGIKILVSGDRSSDSFKAGIANTSGKMRYVISQNGTVNYTFKITESGTYSVYFENTGNKELHILGTIYVNY